MSVMKLFGAFAIIPASLLVALSFFVLVVGQKMAVKKVKTLGYIAAVMLWMGAFVFLTAGVYTMVTGKHPLLSMAGQVMKMHRQMMISMPCPMMQGQCKGMMKPAALEVRHGKNTEEVK